MHLPHKSYDIAIHAATESHNWGAAGATARRFDDFKRVQDPSRDMDQKEFLSTTGAMPVILVIALSHN